MGAGRGAELKCQWNLHQAQVSLSLPRPLGTPQHEGVTSQNRVAAPTLVEDEEGATAQLMAIQSWGYRGAPRVQGEQLRLWHTRVYH